VSQAMLRATSWAHARIVAGVPDTPPFLCMQRSREPSLGLVRKGLKRPLHMARTCRPDILLDLNGAP
jgi:hypothetical protein